MANYFGTLKEWSGSSAVYPEGDYLVALPDNFSGTSGIFPFKVSDGKTAANKLPYAPNRAAFNVIFHTDIPAGGSGITQLTGPITAGPGAGSVATTVTPNAIENTMLDTMPAGTLKGNDAATPADPADLDANQASTILDGATDPFVRTSALPPAGGDVVGPASSTDNNVPQWNGTTGKLLKDGLGTSTGANDAADAGKLVKFRGTGGIFASTGSSGVAISGSSVGGVGVDARSTNSWALYAGSANAEAAWLVSAGTASTLKVNASGASLALEAAQMAGGSDDIALFSSGNGSATITTDGGIEWTGTGAATTRTNLGLGTLATQSGTFSGTSSGTNTGDQTNISGNAATVTTNANLTGPITSVGNATTIADAELAAIAGLTSAADKGVQFTGSGTAALYDLKFGTEAAYTGTPTFTAGAAPSGASSLRQFWERNGNRVTWQIMLTYANTGTTVTNLSLTFPTEFPTPAIPTGFTGADVRLYNCDTTRLISTPSGTITNAGVFMLSRNAADNGFVIASTGTFTSGSYRTFILAGSYFTA